MSGEKVKFAIKAPRGEDGHRYLSIRVEEDIIEELEAIKEKTGQSRNKIINTILKHALKNYEIIGD